MAAKQVFFLATILNVYLTFKIVAHIFVQNNDKCHLYSKSKLLALVDREAEK
jgi:hypothetical protein